MAPARRTEGQARSLGVIAQIRVDDVDRLAQYCCQMTNGPGSTQRSRCFVAGTFHFRVVTDSVPFLEKVQRMFADLPVGDDRTAQEFSAAVAAGGGIHLSGPSLDTDALTLRADAAINQLVWAVNRGSLDAEPERLHIHGAGVGLDGADDTIVGLALVAPSGTGKSTTTAALLNERATYLSDESFSLAPNDDMVRGFSKPVSIKPSGHHLVPHLEEHAVAVHRGDDELWHVPASSLGATAVDQLAISFLLFLERAAASEPAERPIPRSDAIVRLVENSQDFDRFGPEALLTVCRFVSRTTCKVVEVGPVESTVSFLRAFAARDQLEPVDVAVQPNENERLATTVSTIGIGEEAVVHDARSGRLAALGPDAARVWIEFCRTPSSGPDRASTLLEEGPFLEEMARAGFIRDADRPTGNEW